MQLQVFSRREPQTRVVHNLVIDREWRPANPVLRRFDAMWRAAPRRGRLPGRNVIDPAQMADLMPYLMLVDVLWFEDDSMEFRSRLVGEMHIGIDGRNAAGETLFRNPDEADEMMEVVATGCPHYARCRVENVLSGPVEVERAIYPLSDNGIDVDYLAAILAPRPEASRSRLHALFSWF